MRTERIHITDNTINQISYDYFQRYKKTEDDFKRQMLKKILYKTIQCNLTERQRDCVLMYYFKNMKMKEIADSLGLDNSTISRHISSALRKLRHVLSFYA